MITKEQITEDMKQAMRDKDKQTLGTIRMLLAAIKDKSIEVGHELDGDEILAVIGKMMKQRKDAHTQYAAAGREDLAAQEQAEMDTLFAYMPEPLSDAALVAIVDAVIASTGADGMKAMGQVMGAVQKEVAGRADMGAVSGMVKQRLQAAS